MLIVKRGPRIQLSILQQISCNSLSFLEPQSTNYHANHKPQCICFCFVFLQRIERQIFHRRNSWHLTFGSEYDLLFHQRNSDVELPQQHVNYFKKLQHDCFKIMCSLLIVVYEVLYVKRVTLWQFIFFNPIHFPYHTSIEINVSYHTERKKKKMHTFSHEPSSKHTITMKEHITKLPSDFSTESTKLLLSWSPTLNCFCNATR